MKRTTRIFSAIVLTLGVVILAPIILTSYSPGFQDFFVAYSGLVATVVLVGLTAWYAIATSETLAEARKDRRRPTVKHIIDTVLERLISDLNLEIRRIERKEYDYHKADRYRFFNPIPVRPGTNSGCENETERYLLKRLLEERPRIGQLITQLAEEHNNLVGRLRGSYEEIFKALCTPEFIGSFQTIAGRNPPSDGDWYPPFPRPSDFLAAVLINHPDETSITPNSDEFLFYEANKVVSKGFLARPEVQEQIRNRDVTALKLKAIAGQLRQELARFQERLFSEYLS
jgi:hypothetical protein